MRIEKESGGVGLGGDDFGGGGIDGEDAFHFGRFDQGSEKAGVGSAVETEVGPSPSVHRGVPTDVGWVGEAGFHHQVMNRKVPAGLEPIGFDDHTDLATSGKREALVVQFPSLEPDGFAGFVFEVDPDVVFQAAVT